MEVGNAREGIAIQKLTDEVQAEEDDDDDDGNGNAVLKQWWWMKSNVSLRSFGFSQVICALVEALIPR